MITTNKLPEGFKVELPEIYQIEISGICNFACTMCPRTLFPRENDTRFIDIRLIDKLIEEDSFKGSYFVELQMAGEPTLHPRLPEIIDKIKQTGVLVGLSTNGSIITDHLLELDYLTVSVDSDDVRVGSTGSNFNSRLKWLINKAVNKGQPMIDLQVIELPGWEDRVSYIKEEFKEELQSPICNLRTVPDCFLTKFDDPDVMPVTGEVCLNPWMSVSIQSNGNVTACCFSFGDDIILGNIKEQTLKEIWHSEAVEQLRNEHREANYRDICARCYMRSPVLLHWNIFINRFLGRR